MPSRGERVDDAQRAPQMPDPEQVLDIEQDRTGHRRESDGMRALPLTRRAPDVGRR